MLAEGLGNVSSEKVAPGILKNKTKRDNIKLEDKFSLEIIFLLLFVLLIINVTEDSLKKLPLKALMEISNILNPSKRKTSKRKSYLYKYATKLREENIRT